MLLKLLRQIFKFGIYLFAIIGFILIAGWVAILLGLTKTGGIIDANNRYFQEVTNQLRKNASSTDNQNIAQIIADYNQKHESAQQISAWQKTPEWQVLREAIAKDKEQIDQASTLAGVNSRLVVSMLVGEQLRLYNSEREVYKQVFAPLKILGVQSQFSWGVTGLKEATAKKIEDNLRDTTSPFYLGSGQSHLLDFGTTTDIEGQRFARLTDEHNHYYSYLYTALYLRELMAEWQKAGYNISDRPEILATLFNLGFDKSLPKADPQVGGAEIDIGDQKYSFGSLAYQFYYSNELINEFNWQ